MHMRRHFKLIVAILAASFNLLTMSSSFSAEALKAYAQLSSLQTQSPMAGSQAVAMRTVDALSNIEQEPNKVIIKEPGTYVIIATGQVGQATQDKGVNAAGGFVDLWLNKNDRPLPNTGVRQSIDFSQSTTALVTQAIVTLSPRDTISVGYSATKPSLGLVATAASKDQPTIPSMIFSIFKL